MLVEHEMSEETKEEMESLHESGGIFLFKLEYDTRS